MSVTIIPTGAMLALASYQTTLVVLLLLPLLGSSPSGKSLPPGGQVSSFVKRRFWLRSKNSQMWTQPLSPCSQFPRQTPPSHNCTVPCLRRLCYMNLSPTYSGACCPPFLKQANCFALDFSVAMRGYIASLLPSPLPSSQGPPVGFIADLTLSG